MRKIKFGIVGCGVIAPHHAKAVQADERAELAAVCDIIPEKAMELGSKFDVKNVYTDYNEILRKSDIDAVCICLPSGLHGQCAIDSARAGKHILCEKPLDVSRQVMTDMIDAVKQNGVKMGCIFQNRTMPPLKQVKKILDSGELGKMVIVEFQYRGYRSPAYYKSAGWRGTWALDGGGCLMNQGIHGVDAMCWLAGDVVSVYAQTDHMLRDIEVEDTANALLEFSSGAMGVVMGTTLSHATEDSPEGDYFRFECEKGSIVYSGGKAKLYLAEGDSYYSSEVRAVSLDPGEAGASSGSTASDPAKVGSDGHAFHVSDLVSAILEDREPYITGDSARKGVDVVLAIYESSRTGRKILL